MKDCKSFETFLDDWNNDVRNNTLFSGRPFIKDGIINPKKFCEQRVKVLFVSNESNVDGHYELNKTYDIRKDFKDYANDRYDDWDGKLRERVSSLFQVVIKDYSKRPYHYAECFSFLNLNKTGGGKRIDGRLITFCETYGDRIKEEISLIAPDLIIWLGCNTFDNNAIRRDRVGIEYKNGMYLFGRIPVIRMWHTSYFRCRGNRLGVFENAVIDKMAYKLLNELDTLDY